MKKLAWLAMCLLLAACATSQQAPVVERAPKSPKPLSRAAAPEKDWRPDVYIVKKGDTLYAIGLEHGTDYRDIAQWNNIPPPYTISIGQRLRLKAPQIVAKTPEPTGVVVTPLKTEPAPIAKPLGDTGTATLPPPSLDQAPLLTQPQAIKLPYSEQAMAQTTPPPEATPQSPPVQNDPTPSAINTEDGVSWSWPANGKVVAGFNDTTSAKGLDIAGVQGQAVLAAAAGKVVYSGSGLRGYGNLVIIKHNETYLSAYAHNSKILVKEGQAIAKGQKIAEMGSSDASRVQLHFEIRKLGKPVDPIKYLPPAPS